MDSTWHGTVLLADLRHDASKLYAAAGPTRALLAIQQCILLLEQAAWESGATFVKATGDALTALFPAPAAAADAASAMQIAADRLPMIGDTKLGVRIAFQSGPVVVRNGDVLGDTVRMTSELIEAAQHEQIITSRDTAVALGHSYKNRMRSLRPPQAVNAISSLGFCEYVWRVSEDTTRLGVSVANRARTEKLRLKYGITEVIARGEHNPVSLGRDFECGLIILDDLASRRHATIEQRAGDFVLLDHSTNGTYVTEEDRPEVHLRHGHVVLRKHGWLAFGRSRANTDQVVEYFCS
jgi:hypothetical protein